ncbi:hypothetical protein FBU59_003437 [Linderina macrospora]|uniref:Uncharacterized protein n=1 Tax=Linderina macrospora TaxID=4868 RepID=A0ACC1J8L9_9FUNG|nr:hypothetical protein FBU59_003437 [Linderina macrospora]
MPSASPSLAPAQAPRQPPVDSSSIPAASLSSPRVNAPPTELAPLTISASSQPPAFKESPQSTAGNSETDISVSDSKTRRFQWRDLLDPEFYPEITITRTIFFGLWMVPHIILTSYHGTDKARVLVKRMNVTSMHSMLFDVACIMIFTSPTFLMLLQRTFLPRFIKFEKNIHAHKVAAYTMLFWAAVHIGKSPLCRIIIFLDNLSLHCQRQ